MHMKVIYTDKDENIKYFIYRRDRMYIEGTIFLTATHTKIILNLSQDYIFHASAR